jgi:hypothetical protein
VASCRVTPDPSASTVCNERRAMAGVDKRTDKVAISKKIFVIKNFKILFNRVIPNFSHAY